MDVFVGWYHLVYGFKGNPQEKAKLWGCPKKDVPINRSPRSAPAGFCFGEDRLPEVSKHPAWKQAASSHLALQAQVNFLMVTSQNRVSEIVQNEGLVSSTPEFHLGNYYPFHIARAESRIVIGQPNPYLPSSCHLSGRILITCARVCVCVRALHRRVFYVGMLRGLCSPEKAATSALWGSTALYETICRHLSKVQSLLNSLRNRNPPPPTQQLGHISRLGYPPTS